MAEPVILLLQNCSVVSHLWIKAEVFTGNCKPFQIRFHSPLWPHRPSSSLHHGQLALAWAMGLPEPPGNFEHALASGSLRLLFPLPGLLYPSHVACSCVSWRSLGIGLHVKQDASPSDLLLSSEASSSIYCSNRRRHPLTHYIVYLTVYCDFPTKIQA